MQRNKNKSKVIATRFYHNHLQLLFDQNNNVLPKCNKYLRHLRPQRIRTNTNQFQAFIVYTPYNIHTHTFSRLHYERHTLTCNLCLFIQRDIRVYKKIRIKLKYRILSKSFQHNKLFPVSLFFVAFSLCHLQPFLFHYFI